MSNHNREKHNNSPKRDRVNNNDREMHKERDRQTYRYVSNNDREKHNHSQKRDRHSHMINNTNREKHSPRDRNTEILLCRSCNIL